MTIFRPAFAQTYDVAIKRGDRQLVHRDVALHEFGQIMKELADELGLDVTENDLERSYGEIYNRGFVGTSQLLDAELTVESVSTRLDDDAKRRQLIPGQRTPPPGMLWRVTHLPPKR
jgi:hypothetical protein